MTSTEQGSGRLWQLFLLAVAGFLAWQAFRFFQPSSKPADDVLFLVSKNGRFGYINQAGKIAIEPRFEAASQFSEGLAAVRVEGKWGYLRPDGKLAIPPQFDDAADFHEGLAFVANGIGKAWGVIDSSGSFVVQPSFQGDKSLRFSQGLAHVGEYGAMFYIDREGNAVTESFTIARDFKNGFASVMVGTGNGAIDKTGNLVVPATYSAPVEFSEGLAPVWLAQERKGYINTQGLVAIPDRFRVADPFSEGLAPVEENGRVGFIDRMGKTVLLLGTDVLWAEPFSEGLAIAYNNRQKAGYVDKQGKLVIPFRYEHAYPYKNGLAAVSYGFPPVSGYIDKTGRLVWREAK